MSTVGFGDFHPRSEAEQLFCSSILLFGVAIFSYIMGVFISILEQFKQCEADLDEGDKLSKFFGLLVKFNNGKPIDVEMKSSFEKYFEYKWTKDRNQAFRDE